MTAVADTFPRQYARTQRLTLGAPRDVSVSSDGRRIVFLRSRAGDDPVNCLWVADANTGDERLVADPHDLLAGDDPSTDEDLPAEERARRERARESASGITAYATDAAGTVAAFALGGRLFVAGLVSGAARPLDVAGPVFDPRPDPTARRVAYVSGRLLCIGELDSSWWVLAGGDLDEPETISWGSAEFIAAEEMDRFRGYWWSPDGDAIAVCRVDTAPVQRWYIGDPADPAAEPAQIAYPAAGTDNADVSLHIFPIDHSEPIDVEWDRHAFPYLADVHWSSAGLIATVQSRDQRSIQVVAIDPTSGETTVLFVDHDDAWVELVPGSPRLLRRRTARRLRRPRRCPAPPRRRRAGHPAGSAGPRDRGDRRRRRDDHRQPDRRRERATRVALERRWSRTGRRRPGRALRRRRWLDHGRAEHQPRRARRQVPVAVGHAHSRRSPRTRS